MHWGQDQLGYSWPQGSSVVNVPFSFLFFSNRDFSNFSSIPGFRRKHWCCGGRSCWRGRTDPGGHCANYHHCLEACVSWGGVLDSTCSTCFSLWVVTTMNIRNRTSSISDMHCSKLFRSFIATFQWCCDHLHQARKADPDEDDLMKVIPASSKRCSRNCEQLLSSACPNIELCNYKPLLPWPSSRTWH